MLFRDKEIAIEVQMDLRIDEDWEIEISTDVGIHAA